MSGRGWRRTVDVSGPFHADLPDRERFAAIGRIIGAELQGELDETGYGFLPTYLADAEHVDEFDDFWHQLYDWADEHRVWINTGAAT